MTTYTTAPVRPETLARLKAYKWGGATYDDVLNALMDAVPPDRILKDALKLAEEERKKDRGGIARKAKGS